MWPPFIYIFDHIFRYIFDHSFIFISSHLFVYDLGHFFIYISNLIFCIYLCPLFHLYFWIVKSTKQSIKNKTIKPIKLSKEPNQGKFGKVIYKVCEDCLFESFFRKLKWNVFDLKFKSITDLKVVAKSFIDMIKFSLCWNWTHIHFHIFIFIWTHIHLDPFSFGPIFIWFHNCVIYLDTFGLLWLWKYFSWKQ